VGDVSPCGWSFLFCRSAVVSDLYKGARHDADI
jgi:hypothetical protein